MTTGPAVVHAVAAEDLFSASSASSLLLGTSATLDSVVGSATTFEPVLNVPALAVFLLIGGIFAALQWRVSAIEEAAVERTKALQRLRQLKAAELIGPIPPDATMQVREALQAYERAYNRVEQLRTVVPGVRVVPPSQSIGSQSMDENASAAQQFLGIAPPTESIDSEPTASGNGNLSPVLTAVLLLIALSQLALLVLFTTTDPMASSSSMDATINVLSGME